jgi:uncharacterized repeat protein (TIGR02543 family)
MTIFTTLFPTHLRTRKRIRTIIGIVLSVLIHVLLFIVLRNGLKNITPPPREERPPLQVTMVQSPAPPAQRKPTQPKAKPVRKPTPAPAPAVRQQVARRHSAPPVTSLPPSATAITQAPPEMDMSTMLNAARERRRNAETSAATENAAARAAEQGPSANDIARANIAFQERRASGGTNGMFEIVSKGPRVAQYVFRGWTTDARRSKSQTITVDAGLNGDVEKAIIDSMIALIRQYYQGDFNWDSHRLGRVVTLSARQADTAGLRSFLLREFF